MHYSSIFITLFFAFICLPIQSGLEDIVSNIIPLISIKKRRKAIKLHITTDKLNNVDDVQVMIHFDDEQKNDQGRNSPVGGLPEKKPLSLACEEEKTNSSYNN